jgi:hypothetical protein
MPRFDGLPSSGESQSLLYYAPEAFEERYYEWALADAAREVEQDFPFIRRVRDDNAYKFLELIQPMTKAEKSHFITALSRRFRQSILTGIECISPEDKKFIRLFNESDYGEILPGIRGRLPITRYLGRKTLITRDEPLTLARINRKSLSQAAIEHLRSVLGDKGQFSGPLAWHCETQIGPIRVWTSLDAGKRLHHLSYLHHLSDGDKRILNGVSTMKWLGISPQTDWQLGSDSEIDETAEALGIFCKHFVDAVRSIVAERSFLAINAPMPVRAVAVAGT